MNHKKKLEVGDVVLKRGTEFIGDVIKISPVGWYNIAWRDGPSNKQRPAICTMGELERQNV